MPMTGVALRKKDIAKDNTCGKAVQKSAYSIVVPTSRKLLLAKTQGGGVLEVSSRS